MKHIVIIMSLFCSSHLLSGQAYKVMTYNIRYDTSHDAENQWSQRKSFLSHQIVFHEPDVFGIQEGLEHQVRFLDSVLVNYKYIGVGRDDGKTKGEYSAIFYNTNKLKPLKTDTFWLSETPETISVGWDAAMERICTYALFENVKTKEPFWVFNTHFDHRGEEARINSAKLIAKSIEDINRNNYPFILMGDLNLKPESAPIQYLSSVFNDAKMVSLTPPFGPDGTFNGFQFFEPVTNRIDYIFTSKSNIKVLKYAVLSDSRDCKYPSDHLPVFAEVLLKPD